MVPRARTRQGSAHLVRLLIDPRFDGEESPNPNPQERDTRHQRHHTQCLNAWQLQPSHSRNTNNKKPHRGPDVRQQCTLVRQLSPLPSQPVSNSCVRFLRHGRSANPRRNDTPSESKAQQTRREGRAKKRRRARTRRSTKTPDPFDLSETPKARRNIFKALPSRPRGRVPSQ